MSSVRFTWNGDALSQAIIRAAANANYDNAVDLSGEASQQAPIEEGDLRGSLLPGAADGRFSAENGGLDMTVGSDLPYAVRQHEDLSLRHTGPEHGQVDGGKAKYIEDPLNANREKYLQHIADAVKGVTGNDHA